MVAIINKLVGANANANANANAADANDWVTTLALLDFVRRAKNYMNPPHPQSIEHANYLNQGSTVLVLSKLKK